MARTFTHLPGKREALPLLIGLAGPSGGGKTKSALRLATGIQSVVGGDIHVVDTENRRALYYADDYKFTYTSMEPPHASLDILAAVRECVKLGAAVVIIDSISAEHDGEGGYLQTQEAELSRIAGDDYAKRERAKMASWIKPAAYRGQMIRGLVNLNTNLIFTYRAKERTKPIKIEGKTQIVEMGFTPIGADSLVYEMTCNIFLPPNSEGTPQWKSEYVGENMMVKLPAQFHWLRECTGSLDENVGERMAKWARGDAPAVKPSVKSSQDLASIGFMLSAAAEMGTDSLRKFWTQQMDEIERDHFKVELEKTYKPAAAAADKRNANV